MSQPSFSILNHNSDSPIILHVPHSSREIPSEVLSEIKIEGSDLNHELDEITDTLTDEIAKKAIQSLANEIPTPKIFVNNLSRFVIDPERFPDEREVMNKVGMGAVYRKTATGRELRPDDFDDAQLLERYFYPYARAFSELVQEIFESHGRALIIDVHSYRAKQHENAINHGQRRPAMCIGTDSFHTPNWLTKIFQEEFGRIGDCYENQPYSGTYLPLQHYRREPGVLSIMMETRADTFLDSNLRPHRGFEKVVTALSAVIYRISESF